MRKLKTVAVVSVQTVALATPILFLIGIPQEAMLIGYAVVLPTCWILD